MNHFVKCAICFVVIFVTIMAFITWLCDGRNNHSAGLQMICVIVSLILSVQITGIIMFRKKSIPKRVEAAIKEETEYQPPKAVTRVVQKIPNTRFSDAVLEFRLDEIVLDEVLAEAGDVERAKKLFFAAYAFKFRPYRIGEVFRRCRLPLDEEWIEVCQRELDELESGKKKM